jgi:hypothetical protein
MSAPAYQSGEVGNVDADKVVITFDQSVTLQEPEPDSGSNNVAMTAELYGDALIPVANLARTIRV